MLWENAGDIITAVTTVGRFELLDQIGQGGMAVVHLARQIDLDRLVALKELRMLAAPGDPSAAERFLREARLAGSMSHPNIVTVFEHFEHEGTPYIAMEYVEQGSLRPRVGWLTVAQIVGVLEGVLAALDKAERLGIVHRDLKPENLLVTDQGQIKVADFGIAKASTLSATAGLTATGATLGTPAYMAPEQAMAQELGPYTDLYSLGVLAYELLVGRVPFEPGDSALAVLMRHVNEQIPAACVVDPAIDPRLSGWVDRLLIKDPRARTQSAEQAWEELEEVVFALLGSRWRRDARLVTPSAQSAAAPLTPAPFAAQDGDVPPSPGDRRTVTGDGAAAPPSAPAAVEDAATVMPDDLPDESRGEAERAGRRRLRGLLAAPAARRRGPAIALAASTLVLPLGALALRPPPDAPAAPREQRAGSLALTLPPGWRRTAGAGAAGLREGVALSLPAEPTLRVRAGVVESPEAVPGDLPRELAGATRSSGSAYVRLGGRLVARRYDRTEADVQLRLRIYVIAGDRRDLAIVCGMASDSARAGLAACDALAATARLVGERGVAPGVDVAVAAGLKRVTEALDAANRRLEPLLAARSRPRRAGAADDLAAEHRAARATIASLHPRARDERALATVERRLGGLADAYAELSHRAASGSRGRYNRARDRQRTAERLLRTALARLSTIGLHRAS